MKANALNALSELPDTSFTMPVVFLGHGSPMNALEKNEFSDGWRQISRNIPLPKAILCISAHWETNGVFVTAMDKPKTIHDFGGFPKELFEVQYPAKGSPELAQETQKFVKLKDVKTDFSWGLDHGSWSVLMHLYPLANVPVVQLSLDYNMKPADHYNLARQLQPLRKKGILILGSGNMVHNLPMMNWKSSGGFEWAETANRKMKDLIADGNHPALMNYSQQGNEFRLSIPTAEHYLPLLYILALKKEKENIRFFNDKTILGSISMTSLIIS